MFRMSRVALGPRYFDIVAVGIGHRQADGPVYSVFEVL
jgi:hypothetical protein